MNLFEVTTAEKLSLIFISTWTAGLTCYYGDWILCPTNGKIPRYSEKFHYREIEETECIKFCWFIETPKY